MDIHDRVSELEARISKLETHLQRLVSMADPSLQRVMLELDATRGQETTILECPPSKYSMTRKSMPFWLPTSNTGQM
jgi:hypothetical protein